MGSNVDFKEIADFQARAKAELSGAGRDRFMEACTRKLAAEVMNRTVRLTPVRRGVLRRGWKIENPRGRGSEHTLDVANHVEYAPYVEYGHRTKGGTGWARGRYMLTKSLLDVARVTEKYLTTELEKVLRRIEKNGK